MSDYNDLLPEERDDQNKQLMASLHYSYDTQHEDKQSLTSIRERLLQANASSLPHIDQISIMPLSPQLYQKGKKDMQFIHSRFYEGKTWQQRLGTLVAVILVLVLVGSLATVFYVRSHQNSVGSQPTLSPGWKQVVSFSGTGSKTLTHLNIKLTQVWGNSIGCLGQGNVKFELVEISHIAASGCSLDTSALPQDVSTPSLIEPQVFQFSQSAMLTIHTIKVTATGSFTWYIRIANADASTMSFLNTLTAPTYGWVSYSGLGGNGDGKITNQSVTDVVKTLGLIMRCDSAETLQITFNGSNSDVKTFACSTKTNFYVVHFPQSIVLQDIQVHVSSANNWYLETVRCTNDKMCSAL